METMMSNARGWIHDVTGPLTGKNFRDPCNHLCIAVTKALVVLFFSSNYEIQNATSFRSVF